VKDYPSTRTFLLEETGFARRYARCYATGSCSLPDGYHNFMVFVDIVPHVLGPYGVYLGVPDLGVAAPWPLACGCGYQFDERNRQTFVDSIYRRSDTGEEMTLREAGPGAMWDAHWYPWKGSDGRSLIVRCPNGEEWAIDGRASNCTLKEDDVHRCWVRHGEPPRITVDKNGPTCAAGAGSIQAGDYHGFLRDGAFTAQ